MNRTVCGTVVALSFCVAVPFAQQQPAPARESEPAHKVYVLSGCLAAGADATAVFKLTDATAIGEAAPAGAAEPGAVGTSGTKALFELQPVSGVNSQGLDADALKAHAGYRVEVIVRPVEVAPPAAPTAGTTAAQAARPVEEPKPERFTDLPAFFGPRITGERR